MEIKTELQSRIVKLCDDYLVVNKLPGESTEPLADLSGMIDLPLALQKELGGLPTNSGLPTAVHRLDVPVSGCVLFARNPRALAFFNACFRSAGEDSPGQVEKIYWGITELPRNEIPESGDLIHWLAPGKGNRSNVFNDPGPGRKKSVLRYRTLGRGDRYLFLEFTLFTGRHHQIRAQLAHAGLPIKGDLKYGARRSERGGGIRLHSYSLAFPEFLPSPAPGDSLVVVSAPPPVVDNLWDAFIQAAQPTV
ncbi:MAG: RNA pseudouridine synthase [Treponema sp.]|jgi:23S rRNA pseudouridine1911/1915/1917 synthase|nr:RNA pseudouridine synthase [Treponema sp.]